MDIEYIEEDLGAYGYQVADVEERHEEERGGYKEEWHEHHFVSTCCNRPECGGKRYLIPDNVIVICNSCKTFSDFYTDTNYENKKDEVCKYISELPTHKLVRYNVNILVPSVLFILLHGKEINKTNIKNFSGDGEGRLNYNDINLLDFIRYIKSLTLSPQKIVIPKVKKRKKLESKEDYIAEVVDEINNIYDNLKDGLSKSDAETIPSIRGFYRYIEKIQKDYKTVGFNIQRKFKLFMNKYNKIKKNVNFKDLDFDVIEEGIKEIEKYLKKLR